MSPTRVGPATVAAPQVRRLPAQEPAVVPPQRLSVPVVPAARAVPRSGAA